jgi:GH24 family phage-related lysozyme (muramidase)
MTVQSDFETLLASREGCELTVYRDSLGVPTVGIGHRVTAADGLAVGDTITQAQCDAFFAADGASALAAAHDLVDQAGITDQAFLPYLASVCFQLGNHWTEKFPNTWRMIVDGYYAEAANALDGTIWQKQTPVRVADFQSALRRLAGQS